VLTHKRTTIVAIAGWCVCVWGGGQIALQRFPGALLAVPTDDGTMKSFMRQTLELIGVSNDQFVPCVESHHHFFLCKKRRGCDLSKFTLRSSSQTHMHGTLTFTW
jgi:hypothetical protein